MSTATITVTWQIAGKELISFLHAKNNKIYKSNAFHLNDSNGSAKFMLECYSNGMNKGEEGSVDLFLKILSLPEHASDITLRYSLQCVETNTSFTKIKKFNGETTNSCWPYNTLKLNELLSLNILTFECDLQIISITYHDKKTKSMIGYVEKYIGNTQDMKMHKYTSFTWNICNIEYDNFMNCKNRKQINSETFGGKYAQHYQLECYPNGTSLNQRGNVVMGLSLLLLPPLISSCKLFYSFECIQCQKEWSNVHLFSYENSVKGWPVGLIKQDYLYKQTKKRKHITFKCHIEILKLYSHSNQEIHEKYWQRFIIDNTQAQKQENVVSNLQKTIDMMKKEIYLLQRERHNNNINHSHSYHCSPQPHPLPPLNTPYNHPPPCDYSRHHKKKRHPRSRSDIDQLNIHKPQNFYPHRASQSHGHHDPNVHKRKKKKKNKRGKMYGSVNGLMRMSPLDDDEVDVEVDQTYLSDSNYKNWYNDPYKIQKKDNEFVKKQRKKNDEGFAAQIKSFVQINDMVKNDMVTQMETNQDNPFYNKLHSNSIQINGNDGTDENEDENSENNDCKYDNNGKKTEGNNVENINGTHEKIKQAFVKKNKSVKYEQNHKKYRKRHKQDKNKNKNKTKVFHRSQSEKKIYSRRKTYNYDNNYKKPRQKPVVARFVDDYADNEDEYSDYERNELKKWLCIDMGFSIKYFNLFVQNGYDSIDLIVQLNENDLIEIGINNRKYRYKLLKEFDKFNQFKQAKFRHGHYI